MIPTLRLLRLLGAWTLLGLAASLWARFLPAWRLSGWILLLGVSADLLLTLWPKHLEGERELQLTAFLALKAAALPYQYRAYQALLARVCPKVLIKEDACYGPSAALLRPVSACIDRLVDASAVVTILRKIQLTCSNINDAVVRWRDGDAADGQ